MITRLDEGVIDIDGSETVSKEGVALGRGWTFLRRRTLPRVPAGERSVHHTQEGRSKQ